MTGHAHSPYLEDIPLEEALARWFAALAQAGLDRPLAGETVALADAAGRITAEPVWALISSPHYHAAAMDGYAVRAEDTRGASETRPVYLTIGQQAFYVDTGDPLPPGANAVIMVEDVQVRQSANRQISNAAEQDEGAPRSAIEILSAVAPWQHVRPMGEDMVATELILPANHQLRPQDIGAAAGAGHARLNVRRKPRVAIQPTGTELVPPGSNVRPGDIIEYNSLVLGAMLSEWGAAVTRLPPLKDDYAAIRARILEAAQMHDLVIVNAGSSAGSEDFTARIIAELGQVLVHGVTMMPGKPVMLGLVEGKPVIGVPGYPVSAILAFEQFVRPLLFSMQGMPTPAEPEVTATLGRKLPSRLGLEEFVRVILGRVKDRLVAMPLQRGAGVIPSLTRADGGVLLP
jgi:putative molybdopterin biosynthesis protein